MRKINKFKLFSKLKPRSIFGKFQRKILNFKRSKWISVKKKFYGLKKRPNFFKNYELQQMRFKSWNRLNKYFLRGLEIKRVIAYLFDNSVAFYSCKKQNSIFFDKKLYTFHFFIKNEFRIDILLWNLNFCSSSYAARTLIHIGEVLINGKLTSPNYCLVKGDIILIKNFDNLQFFQNNARSCELNRRFLSFVEIDYYLGTIVIVKDFSELSYEDGALLLLEFLDSKNLSLNI